MAKGPERKIVAYPCRGGQYLNMICFVRACLFYLLLCGTLLTSHLADTQMNEQASETWTKKGDINALIGSFSHFAPLWTNLMAYVHSAAVAGLPLTLE
jgi:hypothetical protein